MGVREEYKKLGVFLAYVLRHDPEAAGITLDRYGMADVGELIDGVRRTGREIDESILDEIVSTDEKKRFSYSADKRKIRANQGHSIAVDLDLEEKVPPDRLYHGTAERFLESIKQSGINKKSRNFVHLSKDIDTAVKVGARHGKPIVLRIDTKKMCADGYKFFLSENGVWLTEYVPFEYASIVASKQP